MKKILKIIRISILVFCLVYIVRFFSANQQDLKLILNIGILPLLALYLLSIAHQFVHGFRFKIILNKCSNSNIHTGKWFKIFLQTRFLNMIIPQLGNVYRGISLKKIFNISYTDYISSFTSFAWMDTCFNFIIATVVIAVFEPTLVIAGINAAALTLAITVAVIVLPVLIYKISDSIQIKYHKTLWIQTKLRQVLYTTVTNLKDVKYIIKITTVGIIALVRTITFYYILFRCFDAKPSVTILIIFYTLFKLSSFIVITPGNIGIQELAFGFLSGQLGIGISEGILICAVGRVIGTSVIIVLGILAGGIDILKNRKKYEKKATENGQSKI